MDVAKGDQTGKALRLGQQAEAIRVHVARLGQLTQRLHPGARLSPPGRQQDVRVHLSALKVICE